MPMRNKNGKPWKNIFLNDQQKEEAQGKQGFLMQGVL
jgi:hypothetical protein